MPKKLRIFEKPKNNFLIFKKGQTDTGILLSIIVFQAFILIGIGFININSNDTTIQEYGTPLINFSTNIVSNIAILGWGNLILFAPLGICIGYIIAKLIRGGG